MRNFTTPIQGLYIVDSEIKADHRGAFGRLYCEGELTTVIGSRRIVQINYSLTHTVGAVRGMHFQFPPHAEMKLVRCIKGRVWDVAVDLRAESSTFLKWHAEELSPHNARMLVIPEGCAHGFQALEPDTELVYLHTAFYTPAAEGGIAYNDPILGITWPLAIADISVRDMQHSPINSSFHGIKV